MSAKRGYGAYIRRGREARKLTQRELADRMGTSESTVSNLEREQHPPTVPDQVNDLVLALNLSAEELLSEMGVRMAPASASRLPQPLVERLLKLSHEQWEALMRILPPLDGADDADPPKRRTGR